MKTLLLMLLILPVIASAQTDQLVFFTGSPSAPDLTPELFTSTSFEQVELQFGILNPSQACVSGFEAIVPYEGLLVAPSWTVFGCGANPECGVPPLELSFIECDPVGPDPVYHLGTLTFFVESPAEPIRFFFGPVPGSTIFPDSPGYISDLPFIATPLTTIQGTDWDLPVFSINVMTVANERATWSTVKTLYR